MEEGAINNPHKRRQEEKMSTVARSKGFTSILSHTQSASSGHVIELGAAPRQLPGLRNERSKGAAPQQLPDLRNAGDAGLQLLDQSAPQQLPDMEFDSQLLYQNKKKMEEGAIKYSQEVRPTAARSEAFPSTSHPQSASSGQDINEDIFFSCQSFLIEDMDHGRRPLVSGAAPQQLPYLRNTRFSGAALHQLPDLPNVQSAPQQLVPHLQSAAQQLPHMQLASQQQRNLNFVNPTRVEPSSGETNEGKTRIDVDRAFCSGLLRAAYKGDWPAAKAVLDARPEFIRFAITKEQDTVLHNAVSAKHTTFVTELLKLMTPADLEMESKYKFTALHVAAETGVVTMAKQMVEKNKTLLEKNNDRGKKPLLIAAFLGHRKMVSYLLSVTPFQEYLTIDECFELLRATILHADFYDIALEIVKKMDPKLATAENWWIALLEDLARKPLAICNESQLSFWKRRSNSWIKGICTRALTQSTSAHQLVKEIWKKVEHRYFSSNLHPNDYMTLLFEAAKVGNVEFLIILARTYPDLIWQVDKNNMSLFHIAVLYRHESVFNLIYEIGNNKNSLASYTNHKTKNNMLHLAGELAPPDRLNIVSGAALQMQRELLWFKEIEKNIVPPSYVNMKNSEGKTPKEIFIKTHKDLQKDGEKWMKDTANHCMLVATLIATVIFAAAFTVPGGSNQETGTPIFLRSNWFMIFFISDATALCSSSTSIVIFLSILTSRYTEEDFLKSLPSKLVFGLATLFISMASMMVAFSATCFLVYSSARAWAPVVVIISASIPVTLFVLVHHKLWGDIFISTYQSRFLFRSYKRRLF